MSGSMHVVVTWCGGSVEAAVVVAASGLASMRMREVGMTAML